MENLGFCCHGNFELFCDCLPWTVFAHSCVSPSLLMGPFCSISFLVLHNCGSNTSVTNVSETDYPSVVYALTNCHQLSNPCALHHHFGLILCTGDTSVAGPAQVTHNHACSQFIVCCQLRGRSESGGLPSSAIDLVLPALRAKTMLQMICWRTHASLVTKRASQN